MFEENKTILISGGSGLLAGMLKKVFEDDNFTVINLKHPEFDITDSQSISSVFDNIKPAYFINCASYTNVDQAENDVEKAMRINGYAVGVLARECMKRKIHFIHISSDYVFGDNKKDGHKEDDDPGETQLNVYGKSKRLGEVEAIKNNPNSFIVRTSWSFGPNGHNFVDMIIGLAKSNGELQIVDDEIGVPTYTKESSKAILYLLKNIHTLKPGFYHTVSEGSCSRFDEAKFIFDSLQKQVKLTSIKLKDYARIAKVPNYSILLNTKLPKLPGWRESIREYFEDEMK